MGDWLIKNPMTKFYIIAGTTLSMFVIILAAAITAKINSSKMCTLVGCIGGIEVKVVDLPESTPFTVGIVFPSGETQFVSCSGNAPESIPFENSCSSNIAFFGLPADAKPPKEITVIVVTESGQWKKVIRPEYEEFQPNGEDYPPICYNADIIITVAE